MSSEDRDFLFSSLEDLEREYAAGDMDTADYEALKSSYVKRLADVLRSADVGDEPVENADVVPARNGKKLVLTVAVVLCVAVGPCPTKWDQQMRTLPISPVLLLVYSSFLFYCSSICFPCF